MHYATTALRYGPAAALIVAGVVISAFELGGNSSVQGTLLFVAAGLLVLFLKFLFRDVVARDGQRDAGPTPVALAATTTAARDAPLSVKLRVSPRRASSGQTQGGQHPAGHSVLGGHCGRLEILGVRERHLGQPNALDRRVEIDDQEDRGACWPASPGRRLRLRGSTSPPRHVATREAGRDRRPPDKDPRIS